MRLTGTLRALLLLSTLNALAIAESPRDELAQLVSRLRTNPGDYELRERIVRLGANIRPTLSTPEDAERHMVRGGAALKTARQARDFADAVSEFEKAILAAPWLPDGYYNLGIAKEKVGDYAGAIRDLKIYLASNPAESDAKQAKALVYEIEYRQEKDEKDKQELKRQADLKAAEEYEKFGWLLGTWNWERRFPAVNDNRSGILELRKDGNYIIPYYDGRPLGYRWRALIDASGSVVWEVFDANVPGCGAMIFAIRPLVCRARSHEHDRS